MVNVLLIIGITFITLVIGGGLAYLLYIQSRPKKEIWNARIYKVGRGEIHKASRLKAKDLVPFGKDLLEKVEKDNGMIIYRLQKLNKTTPAVQADLEERWGEKNKYVDVLYDGVSCTLLRKTFEDSEKVFEPVDYATMNMIQHELTVKKDRLKKEKDVLTAITPWVIAGICMMGLVGLTYFNIQGFVQVGNQLNEMSRTISSAQITASENYALAITELKDLSELKALTGDLDQKINKLNDTIESIDSR